MYEDIEISGRIIKLVLDGQKTTVAILNNDGRATEFETNDVELYDKLKESFEKQEHIRLTLQWEKN